jgi:hypothetical protein
MSTKEVLPTSAEHMSAMSSTTLLYCSATDPNIRVMGSIKLLYGSATYPSTAHDECCEYFFMVW